MRLDKYLGNATLFSRSDIKKAIKQGMVTVNGATAQQAAATVNSSDTIVLYGEIIHYQRYRYYMLYKPAGVVSATKDTQHPTALDLLDDIPTDDLQIVGRLDKDTTGLLLITNDGNWNHRITSPKSGCQKVYQVRVAEPLRESAIQQFATGLMLNGEDYPTLPAKLTIEDSHNCTVTLSEGRYHQVKRMFAAIGNHVESLHRQQVGNIMLDPDLNEGDYRELSDKEIAF